MRKTLVHLGAIVVTLTAPLAARADAVSDFYAGKQLSFIVPTPPGGSYDGYGRLLSRYLGKYIPGRGPEGWHGADCRQSGLAAARCWHA